MFKQGLHGFCGRKILADATNGVKISFQHSEQQSCKSFNLVNQGSDNMERRKRKTS